MGCAEGPFGSAQDNLRYLFAGPSPSKGGESFHDGGVYCEKALSSVRCLRVRTLDLAAGALGFQNHHPHLRREAGGGNVEPGLRLHVP